MLKKLLKKSSLYFILLVIGKFLTALFFLLLARKLASPAQFGIITFFITLVQLLGGISDFGLKNWYQKQMATACHSSLLLGMAKWRWFFYLLTVLLLIPIQHYFNFLPSGFIALLIALFFEACLSIADGYYLSRQESLRLGTKLIIRNLLLLPVLAFINQGSDYEKFFWAYNFSLSLTLLYYFPWKAIWQSRCGLKQFPNIKSSVPFAMVDSLGMIYNRADHLFIKNYLGSASLGIFGVAYRYLDAVNLLPQALFHNLFPLAAKKNGISLCQLKKIVLIMTGCGMLTATAICLLSPLLTTWILGPQYQAANTLLRQLSVIVILFFFNAPLNTIIQSSNYLKKYVPYLIAAVIINLLVNLLLLPKLQLLGAVLAMIISEFALVIFNLKFIFLIYRPQLQCQTKKNN